MISTVPGLLPTTDTELDLQRFRENPRLNLFRRRIDEGWTEAPCEHRHHPCYRGESPLPLSSSATWAGLSHSFPAYRMQELGSEPTVQPVFE